MLHFIVVYSENKKSCDKLLQINKEIFIHQKDLRVLILEVYKNIAYFNQKFTKNCFTTNPIPYNLIKKVGC